VPDSLIHEYRAQNFTSSNWPDTEQSADIVPTGPTSSLLNGEPSVSADGVDDFGLSTTMGSFGSDMDTDFAIEFVLQTGDTGFLLGVDNSTNSMGLSVVTNSAFGSQGGRLAFVIRSANNNSNFTAVDSSVAVDDTVARHIIINKKGNAAADIDIAVNAQDKTGPVVSDKFNSTNTVDFDEEMVYFAVNDAGNVVAFHAAELPFIRWYNDSLSNQQQQALFDRQRYI
jgi:hypothetical protein